MSKSQAEDDDWEVNISEIQSKLNALGERQTQVKLPQQTTGSGTDAPRNTPTNYTATTVPPMRLMTRPIQADSNPDNGIQGPLLKSALPDVPSRSADEVVDSALLNAMENPRDRMQLLQLEKNMAQFVKSYDRELELPPMHNSFWRLLAFRLSERFRLGRRTADTIAENGERGIIFFKTPEVSMPRRFLYDLSVGASEPESVVGKSGNAFAASDSRDSRAGNNQANPAPARKVMLMQRNPNNLDAKKDTAPRKSAADANKAADRDREYEELRARIFGGDGATSPSTVDPASNQGVDGIRKVTSDPSLSKPVKKAQDTSKWTGKKSITRDADFGRYDPDFVRHSPVQSMPSPYYAHGMAYPQMPPAADAVHHHPSMTMSHSGGYYPPYAYPQGPYAGYHQGGYDQNYIHIAAGSGSHLNSAGVGGTNSGSAPVPGNVFYREDFPPLG